MIVASLLLILVAVTLLVLGLTGGSSGLLISSIVASLLAAVFLVIGARQSAAARRAAERPAPGEPGYGTEGMAADQAAYADPEDAVFLAEPEYAAAEEARRRREAAFSDDLPPYDAEFAGDSPGSPMSGRRDDQRDTVQFAPPVMADDNRSYAADSADVASGDLSVNEAHVAGRRDAEAAFAAEPAAFPATGPGAALDDARTEQADYDGAAFDGPPRRDGAAFDGSARRDGAGYDSARAGDYDRVGPDYGEYPGGTPDADYDRAFTAINAARSDSPGDDAWHRTPAAAGETTDQDDWRDQGLADQAGVTAPDPAAQDVDAGEFGEADADDPADEPLPQAVRPADAVRVARLDNEVLVVDGRPRYHLADCSHLAGRLTEPIPVNEAVELGFSPCGLCRPVDRLVAAAARR